MDCKFFIYVGKLKYKDNFNDQTIRNNEAHGAAAVKSVIQKSTNSFCVKEKD